MLTKKEKRILKIDGQNRHTRALKDAQGNKVLEGYAAVFNQRSRLIWEWGDLFFEVIEPRAFDQVLASDNLDVILTYNHGKNPLARLHKIKGVKTLELSADAYGLKFRAILNHTTEASDTWERVNSGDVFECSFIFTVEPEGQRWDKTEDGAPLRFISNISGLYDVSAVVNGAYANTDLQAAERSFNASKITKDEHLNGNYYDAMLEEILQLSN